MGATNTGLQLLQAIGGGCHRAGGGGGASQNFAYGGKGWVRGKEARSGSPC